MKAAETIECNDTVRGDSDRWIREKKEIWKKNKRMYGQLVREMPETMDEKETWYWLRKTE